MCPVAAKASATSPFQHMRTRRWPKVPHSRMVTLMPAPKCRVSPSRTLPPERIRPLTSAHFAAGTAAAQQPCLQHAGIVGHQQGAFGQAVRQVAEHVVFQAQGAAAAHGQQARRAPLVRGILGYLLLGQLIGIVLQQKIIFGNENRRHGFFLHYSPGRGAAATSAVGTGPGDAVFSCPPRTGRRSRAAGETLVSPCRRGYPFRAVRPPGRQLKEYSQCDAYLSP